MRKTPDGSIIDDKGQVVFFSVSRFIKDICELDCCFICGASRDTKEFNDEHVIPDWLLRKHQLHDQKLILPNGHNTTYSRNKVPCCLDCNELLGRELEEPVRNIFSVEYNEALDLILNANALGKLFRWLCLTVFKTHYRDRSMRWSLDQRRPDDRISDVYDWKELHHIHAIARSIYSKCKITPEVLGSICLFPMKTGSQFEDFDFVDLYPAQSVLIKSGQMGVVAVLNDSGAANIGFEPISKKISGALSNIQLREILSHLSTINMHLKHRPKYSTLCDLSSGEALITASIPEDFEIERPYYETFGGLLHFTCGNIIRQSRIPNMEAFLAKIKEGNHTFLFNGDGTFKENVSREIRGNNSD